MNIRDNRLSGMVLLAVGICWLATLPALLLFMVSMEGSVDAGSNGAAWRLWRALEVLFIEPRWLAYALTVLMWVAPLLGAILAEFGVATLVGKARAPKWVAAPIAAGIAFCGIGSAVHWLLLMPVVRASDNPAVARACDDLNLAIPAALGAGVISMIVAGATLLGPSYRILIPRPARKRSGA